MAIGTRGQKWRERHNLKKQTRLFPEKFKTDRLVLPGGSEADRVVHEKNRLGGVVTKTFTIGRMTGLPENITWRGMLARFKIQKEMHSAGVPVARPISIKREGNKIIWREEGIEGGSLSRFINHEKSAEEMPDAIHKAKKEAKEKLYNFTRKNSSGLKTTLSGGLIDFFGSNMLWDPVKKRVVFTDLGLYRKEKKAKK